MFKKVTCTTANNIYIPKKNNVHVLYEKQQYQERKQSHYYLPIIPSLTAPTPIMWHENSKQTSTLKKIFFLKHDRNIRRHPTKSSCKSFSRSKKVLPATILKFQSPPPPPPPKTYTLCFETYKKGFAKKQKEQYKLEHSWVFAPFPCVLIGRPCTTEQGGKITMM